MTLALGGMTVEELDQRMSLWELRGWQLFEETYGPLHQSIRVEGAIARAVAPFLKNAKPDYLMPWPKESEQEGSMEDVLKLLQGAAKAGKVKRKKRMSSKRMKTRRNDGQS